MSALGTLHALGAGPGDPELITLKAVRVLAHTPLVFAAASSRNDYSLALSIVSPHLTPGVPVVRLPFPMTRNRQELEAAWTANAAQVLDHLHTGQDAAFVTLGDPVTYSTYQYLRRTLLAMEPGVPLAIVSGVSSIQAAAAAAGWGLAESGENLLVLSGVDSPERLHRSLEIADNAVILKAYRTFPQLRALLTDMGLAHKAVLVSRCGLPGQAVHHNLADCPDKPPYFSLILVKK